ncbi:hypothetical protein EDB89DRAFT_2230400 [Lactarius sanguifluus]|nr:hypothetical protein EDB89DRAFT_2230400 [Lactarius sanguifluus]
MRQKLCGYIQDSARKRMYCEDDVLRYYRQFICFGLPLVHAGHLSGEEHDAAFWYGFHPDDREVLQPHLIGKNPFQPSDVPFHFKDVLSCARVAFAYNNYFQSPWSHAKHFRAVTRTVTTYAETTPDDSFLPSYSTPDSDFPLSSISPSESQQHTQAPSVTLNQPEPAYMLSTTLPPSTSPLSHTPSLVYLATDNNLIPAPTFSIPSSIFVPSVTEDRSEPKLAPVLFASVPTLPSTPSHVHSAINNSTSTPPSSSPTLSTCLPSVTEEQPESEPEPMPSIAPASIFASTPHSSSSVLLTNLEYVPLAMVDRHEFEPEHTFLSSITPTPSLPAPSLALEFTDDVCELLSLPPTPQSASLACSEVPTSLSSPTRPSPSENPTLVPAHSLPSLRPSPKESCCNLVLEPLATPASSYPHVSPSSLGELIPLLPAQHEASVVVPTPRHLTPPQRPPGFKIVGLDCSTLEVTPSFTSSIPRLRRQEPPLVYEFSSTPTPSLPLAPPPLPLSCFGLAHNFALAIVIAMAFISTLLNISKTLSTFARKFWSKYEDISNNRISTLNTSSRDVFAQQLRLGQYMPCGTHFVFDPGGPASRSSFKLLSTHEDACKRMPKTRNNFITHITIPIPVPIDNIIFDPRGGAFKSEPAHEDIRKHNLKTCNGFTILDTSSPIPIPTDNLTVFNPRGVAFVLEPAHEDSTMFDEDAQRLSLHA